MPAPQLRKPPPRISATAAATIKVHELVEFQPCVADEFPQGTLCQFPSEWDRQHRTTLGAQNPMATGRVIESIPNATNKLFKITR